MFLEEGLHTNTSARFMASSVPASTCTGVYEDFWEISQKKSEQSGRRREKRAHLSLEGDVQALGE